MEKNKIIMKIMIVVIIKGRIIIITVLIMIILIIMILIMILFITRITQRVQTFAQRVHSESRNLRQSRRSQPKIQWFITRTIINLS